MSHYVLHWSYTNVTANRCGKFAIREPINIILPLMVHQYNNKCWWLISNLQANVFATKIGCYISCTLIHQPTVAMYLWFTIQCNNQRHQPHVGIITNLYGLPVGPYPDVTTKVYGNTVTQPHWSKYFMFTNVRADLFGILWITYWPILSLKK